MPSPPGGRVGTLLVALIDVIAGIVILSWPDLGLSTLGVIIGIVLVLRGLLIAYAGWLLVALERADRDPGGPALA